MKPLQIHVLKSDRAVIEIYLTASGEIVFSETSDSGLYFIYIPKSDWQEVKSFVDGQFNQ